MIKLDMLKLTVILMAMPCVITISIINWSPETLDHTLLQDSAFNFGIPHLITEDVQHLLQDVMDEDIIVLYGGQRLTLLNSNQVAVEKGQIITAGSNVCKSSCDKYNGQLKKGKFPYLDSSIVLGYKSDLLRVLPQDLANLQTFLSDQFLAGGSDILVDTSGEKISTIGEDNFQLAELEFTDTNNTLILEGSKPNIVHLAESAPIPAQRLFSEIGRYVGNGITRTTCNSCNQKKDSAPTLFIVVYIEEHYPFLSNLLKSLQDMKYDKSRVELVILSLVDSDLVNEWSPEGFKKFTHLQEEFDSEDHDSKHYFLEMYAKTAAEYFVFIDSSVHITADTIHELVSYQKPVIAPLLAQRDGTAWSNFWGTFTDTWGYKRSADYANILTRTVQGVMPVACVRNLYVVERSVAVKMVEWNAYDNHLEPDISFCKTLFENRVPVFISNVHNYGWLKTKEDGADLKLAGPFLEDWKEKYVSYKVLEAEAFSEPCKNVFLQKAAFTVEFGRDMVTALDSLPGYSGKPKFYDRPGYNVTKSVYNETLTSVILDLTEDVVSKLYAGYKPKGELYDSWIIEVEGKFEKKRHVYRGNTAAYHVLVPLNDYPAVEGAVTGYFFTKQSCYVTDIGAGDLLIFPGFITHQKVEVEPPQGMHLYLEMSFDPPK